MKIIITVFSLLFIFIQFGLSQENKDLNKVDEFGNIQAEDLASRLDVFANVLKQTPASIGYITVYQGANIPPGFAYKYGAQIKTYLEKAQNLRSNRIILDIGTPFSETKVELYIGSNSPVTSDRFHLPKFNANKSLLFDRLYYRLSTEEFECCPTQFYESQEAKVSLKALSEILKKYPASRAYLISYLYKFQNYNGEGKLDPVRRADIMLRKYKNELMKNGIKSSRIIIVKGGYRKTSRHTEVWLVPNKTKMPKSTPNFFPVKGKR